jgi:hypothetical protein
MGARKVVLLTPSKSVNRPPLLSYKQTAPVTPLFATLTKSAYLYHSAAFSRPLFSCSYALFCIQQKLNSFLFMRFRTLCQKHPGGGGGVSSQNSSAFLLLLPLLPALHSRCFPSRIPCRAFSVISVLSVFSVCSAPSVISVLVFAPSSLPFDFQLSIEDPDPVGTVDSLLFHESPVTNHQSLAGRIWAADFQGVPHV